MSATLSDVAALAAGTILRGALSCACARGLAAGTGRALSRCVLKQYTGICPQGVGAFTNVVEVA